MDATSRRGDQSSSQMTQLPQTDRDLHRALLTELLATGQIPPLAELSEATGLTPDVVAERLVALADGDYLAFDETERLTCLYPLSTVPTPHVVIMDGKRRHAMCPIDALGMAAMLGQVIGVEGTCARCGRRLRLEVRPGQLVQFDPPDMVVVARRDEARPAAGACCPFTVFACCAAHGQELANRLPDSSLLSLREALQEAEWIFGDLLQAEVLPASRRRLATPSEAS